MEVELDGLLSVHVKNRDGWQCVKCHSSMHLQAAHVLAKSHHGRLRFEPMNILTLCAGCHLKWHREHEHGIVWFEKRFPGAHERLQIAEECAPKVDLKLLLCVWRSETKEIMAELRERAG
jgi:5-methylcytosine-specific restriction endonuclease McrA